MSLKKVIKNKLNIIIVIISIFLPLIMILVNNYFNLGINININPNTYSTLVSVSGSLIGFLITTLSILFILPEKGNLKLLKQHKSYQNIFYVFLIAIFGQILLFINSLISMFGIVNYPIQVILSMILIFSLSYLGLCIFIFKKMLDVIFNN